MERSVEDFVLLVSTVRSSKISVSSDSFYVIHHRKLVPFYCWALAAAEWIYMGVQAVAPCISVKASVCRCSCWVSGTPRCLSYSEVPVLPDQEVEMLLCVTRCPPPDTEVSFYRGPASHCPGFQDIFSYSEFHKQQSLTPYLMLEVVIRTHTTQTRT